MVVTPEEEILQKAPFEVTWTDEESGVAKKAKKVWWIPCIGLEVGFD